MVVMPHPEVRIRRAEPTDARIIAEINHASWESAYRGLMPDGLIDSVGIDAREERQRVHLSVPAAESPRSSWIADVEGRAVGYTSLGPQRDEGAQEGVGEVYSIYLLPIAVGKGIGRELLAHAMGVLRDADFREAVVWFHTGNHRARRFYAAAGFDADMEETMKLIADFEVPCVRYRVRLS